MDAARFAFLYRQAEGRVDAPTWRRAALAPVALAALMTLVWIAIAPAGPRDMATEPFFDWRSVAIFSYFLAYVLVLLLCAVAYYFVSAKRFADLGLAQEWAGLALMALFLAGAGHWYQPRSEGAMPQWAAWLLDALALAAALWTAARLAYGRGAAAAS